MKAKGATLNFDFVISKWIQVTIYVALILFTNMYLGLFTRARAGDMISLTTVDQNAPLKDIMKQIGADFKAIGQTFSNTAQTDANVAHANELTDLFTLAAERVPDTISKLAPGDRPAATQDYQNQIKAMAALSVKLAAALQAKDGGTIVSILTQMKDGKEKGHDAFKPDDN